MASAKMFSGMGRAFRAGAGVRAGVASTARRSMGISPGRLMTRAAGRMGALSTAGGLREGWKMMRGSVGAGAWKGAAIGAGLGVASSLIGDATNGDFNGRSIGRAIGAGMRGSTIGGIAGAGFGAGKFFLGSGRKAMTANARGLGMMSSNRATAAGMTGMTMGMGNGINMMGRRSMGGSMRSFGRRNMPTFGRMGMTARNFGRDIGLMGRDATRNRVF